MMSVPATTRFKATKAALEKYDGALSQLMICPHTATFDTLRLLTEEVNKAEEAIQDAFVADIGAPKLSRLRSFAKPNEAFRTFVGKFSDSD